MRKCEKCGREFKSGDCVYKGNICKECGGKGMPIFGILSGEDYIKMLEKQLERDLESNKKLGSPCNASILRKMLYLKKIKKEGKK